MVWDENKLIAWGYVPLDEPAQPDMPTYGKMQLIHRAADIQWRGIASYRTRDGWKFYRTPNAVSGFTEEPMLPLSRLRPRAREEVRGMTVATKVEGIERNFVWGPIVQVHTVGPYKIVEYHPQIFAKNSGTGRYDYDKSNFHPYVDGKDTNQSFETLDAALAGAIAHRQEGYNHRADRYFIAALERLQQKEPA